MKCSCWETEIRNGFKVRTRDFFMIWMLNCALTVSSCLDVIMSIKNEFWWQKSNLFIIFMPEISMESVRSILLEEENRRIAHWWLSTLYYIRTERFGSKIKEIVGLDWRMNFEVSKTRTFCRTERGREQKQDLTS